MITLDEQGKYNWTIKYTILDNNIIVTVAEGKYFSFIPRTDDIIKIDGLNYKVMFVIQDFDNETIWISMKFIINKKTSEK